MTTGTSHIEVELRGLLPYSQHGRLIDQLKAVGHLDSSEHEENIYYKDTGLRLRRTATKVTLTAKTGDAADTAREEIEVALASANDFDKAAAIFKILGYETIGGTQVRSREAYSYRQALITIEYYPDFHAFGFEIERIVSQQAEIAPAQAELKAIAGELGLKTYSKEVFYGVMQLVQSILESGLSTSDFITATRDKLKEIVPNASPTLLEALDEIRAELTR